MTSWLSLDSAYAWRVLSDRSRTDCRIIVLELTSQAWFGPGFSDRPIWRHFVTITIPPRVLARAVFLHIGGGPSDGPPPDGPGARFVELALAAEAVVVELGQVPNQPICFADTPDIARREDDIIAYLLGRYEGDVASLPRYPMVKSIAAAMTAVGACLADICLSPWLDRFVLAGSSKRGWAAWLAGVMDPRVIGIVPIVINVVNVEASIRHHFRSLGFFSPALAPYLNQAVIPNEIGGPKLRSAMKHEDPFNYLGSSQMQIPKLVINASGDDFFPPDATRFYFRNLPGRKDLRVLPNSPHSPAGTDINETILAWFIGLARDEALPVYRFSTAGPGEILLETAEEVGEVLLWEAHNPTARDFRFSVLGETGFKPRRIAQARSGEWRAKVNISAMGFTAFFLEASFPRASTYLKVTSEVQVAPDVLPFAWPGDASAPSDVR